MAGGYIDQNNAYAGGAVALHRTILNHWIMDDPIRYWMWSKMLLYANWKPEPKEVRIKNEVIMCGRGQICFSVLTWVEKFRNKAEPMTRDKVRGFFKLLERAGMITLESTTQTTIITVCNYDSYNIKPPTKTQQRPNEDPQPNKGNKPNSIELGYTEAEKSEFAKFAEWIKINAEEVSKMDKPFTALQYFDVKKRYMCEKFPGGSEAGKAFVKKIIMNMANYKPLRNNKSAYLTFLNWSGRDYKKEYKEAA